MDRRDLNKLFLIILVSSLKWNYERSEVFRFRLKFHRLTISTIRFGMNQLTRNVCVYLLLCSSKLNHVMILIDQMTPDSLVVSLNLVALYLLLEMQSISLEKSSKIWKYWISFQFLDFFQIRIIFCSNIFKLFDWCHEEDIRWRYNIDGGAILELFSANRYLLQ